MKRQARVVTDVSFACYSFVRKGFKSDEKADGSRSLCCDRRGNGPTTRMPKPDYVTFLRGTRMPKTSNSGYDDGTKLNQFVVERVW